MPQLYTNNIAKYVKNLGWLQRHLDLVKYVEVIEYPQPSKYQGVMGATLTDGRVYQCEWASLKLCAKWLARPSLTGVPCFWINHTTTCDQLKHYHF